jgi:hypothetical protein
MITNGLSDPAGLVSDCRQQITLNFDFKTSGINSLLRLSRDSGGVEAVGLISDGGSRYHLSMMLDGGTGDLFKFNDGAPFVGFYVPEPSALGLAPVFALGSAFKADQTPAMTDSRRIGRWRLLHRSNRWRIHRRSPARFGAC